MVKRKCLNCGGRVKFTGKVTPRLPYGKAGKPKKTYRCVFCGYRMIF